MTNEEKLINCECALCGAPVSFPVPAYLEPEDDDCVGVLCDACAAEWNDEAG